MTVRHALLAALALCALAALPACPGTRAEAVDPSTLPEDIREPYALFAQRCSKCHSLARPLNSGIVDDHYWELYVARMRRQPGSGISLEDSKIILRFLHYYSLDQRRKKEQGNEPPLAPGAPVSPPQPPPPTSADGGTE